ncbi:MAG: dTDP-4-dehydrorhamnose reductase [Acidobacteriaceae bacterium]
MSEPSPNRLRILLTGKDGQVGWELARALTSLGDVTATSRAELDLASDASIRTTVRAVRPHLIVNAAAYTAVDRAENEPQLAQRINADAVATLAAEAKQIGAAMIHYSTDYVFDGAKLTLYMEQDATNPLGVYGRTKLAGEQALAEAGIPYLVLRTSWVYGARGKNFLRTILKLAAEKPELRIVADQTGAPTWSQDIAAATLKIAKRWLPESSGSAAPDKSGIYHLTASGETTWYGFAEEAIRMYGRISATRAKLSHVSPIASAEYPTPAARPKNSRLNCAKLAQSFDCRLPDWKASLAAVLGEIASAETASTEPVATQVTN